MNITNSIVATTIVRRSAHTEILPPFSYRHINVDNNSTVTITTTTVVTTTTAGTNSSCTAATATLRQTSPGVYTSSFTPPSLTGTVTIYIKACALADDNGRIFPEVDTSIGSYAYAPSSATGSSVPPSTGPPPGGSPVAPPLISQAVEAQATQPATESSPIEPLMIILSALAVAGAILVLSRRR
jgi:hypothetical protein